MAIIAISFFDFERPVIAERAKFLNHHAIVRSQGQLPRSMA